MGARSFGRYQLLELLGQGGMGEVYRAHDTATERIVAVKLLPANLAGDSAFDRRFRREARIAAGLNDPHVVPIHNYGEIDGQLYVDMRLIEGCDLHTLIANEGGRLSAARAVAIIEQVATALDTAHQAELVHRDVKPSNILITGRDFAYLIDFGIARAATDTAMTKTGHTVGTFAYMAPERFAGTTDPRADVYALACVLFECLTGDKPYPGDSLEQQVASHLSAPPPQPSSSYPDVPPALDAVIAKGMAKDPDDRYQTASELADAARAALTSPRAALSSGRTPQSRARGTAQPHPSSAATAKSKPNKATVRAPQAKSTAANQRRRATAQRKLEEQLQLRAEEARRRRNLTIIGGSVAAVAVIIAIVVIVVVGNNDQKSDTASTTTSSSAVPATMLAPPLPAFQPAASVGANCRYPPSQYAAAKPANPPHTGKVPTDPATISISMATSQGHIGLLLANNESPCTVNSFISLATQGYFNGTKCHRLTTERALAILQCGDPKNDGSGGPGYQFPNEYPTDQYPPNDPNLTQPVVYPRGIIAMAHSAQQQDNGSQFFLVYRDSQLPPDYTVFGKIQDDGLATLDKIAKAGVVGGGPEGNPVAETIITSVLPG